MVRVLIPSLVTALAAASPAPEPVVHTSPGAAGEVRPVAAVSAVRALGNVAARSCTDPGQVIDLDNWKITLPVRDPARAKVSPLEVRQPQLAAYTVAPWFTAAPGCDAVVFRAPVDGVTTSGSSNPRSELREMTDHGTTNAGWSSTEGAHTLTVTEAFTHLPESKPQLVGAQIHDADDDITVFRLEGRNLCITDGNNPHYKLVTSGYTLGTRFDAKFAVSHGEIAAYYNGVLQTTLVKSFTGGYFKAGAYTQANCGNSSPCTSTNYGEMTIYALSVDHHPEPEPPLTATTPAAPARSQDTALAALLALGGLAVLALAGFGYRVLRRRRAP